MAFTWGGRTEFTANAEDPTPAAAATLVAPLENALVQRAGTQRTDPASTNQPQNRLDVDDRVRTLENGRATIRLGENSLMHVDQLTVVRIVAPRASTKSRFALLQGLFYVLHRDRPVDLEVETAAANAAIQGTDFAMSVDETGLTRITVIDGVVQLSNPQGTIRITNGEQGTARPGQAPTNTSLINAINVVQWSLYYPGVLDPDELKLDSPTNSPLGASLAAYRTGDLVQAFNLYNPGQAQQPTAQQSLYRAALLLAVGRVADSEALIRLNETNQLTGALRLVIAAVKNEEVPNATAGHSPSRLLGYSYYQQSRHDLNGALTSTYKAVSLSTNFGFGWERVAELEFSFGRVSAAERALTRALQLAPRNPQAHALRGFLLAAENRIGPAIQEFDTAINIDSRLANAWLGRGLCRIKRGDLKAGREDLQTAAVLEPTRSLFRSYLGKSFASAGELSQAQQELALAKRLDGGDPTPWLYSALLKQEQNRVSEAIEDLEKSQQLSDNRAVFRSRMLLDQDRAVRSASLASIYHDGDMNDVSEREAARAVEYDYANYSAHLFLANSFDALRDPTRFNLRYETPWFNELLLANLQAPAGVPAISPNISQQEYGRLFERDRLGLTTTTELRSDGQYHEAASQFGAIGPFSYSLDLDWQRNEGVRPNNELSRTEWYSQFKYQLGPQDSFFALIKYQDYHSGDNYQYYDPRSVRPAFDFSETQTPILLAGWHHEWSPGIHTILLGGRLVNDQHLSDLVVTQTVAIVNPAGKIDPGGVPFDQSYSSDFEVYSAELNQVFQREKHTDILGARFQDGLFRAQNIFDNPPPGLASSVSLPSVSSSDNNFRRLSLYGYHHWQVIDGLLLIGGLTYDNLRFPANFRRPPLSSDEAHESRVSPKAALLWDLTPRLRARGVYAQAVGGVSYDESVGLEPTQLAGFSQAFRSLISESLPGVGPVEAPRYDLAGGALDLRAWKNSWFTIQGEAVRERVDREIGIFFFNFSQITPASTGELLDYHEYNASFIFNQIAARDWFLQAQYQFTRSELGQTLPDIPASPTYVRTSLTDADLHQFGIAATWRDPSGFFARVEFWEIVQRLQGSTPQPPGDDFPLLNLYIGYRFPRRRGEVALGVMNLCGDDYHFSPLNYHTEYPHQRVFYSRFTFNF